jgi:hypothetical protein
MRALISEAVSIPEADFTTSGILKSANDTTGTFQFHLRTWRRMPERVDTTFTTVLPL